MNGRKCFCELIRARNYYGVHATGWVVLCNGYPHHFTGIFAKRDAQDFLERRRQEEQTV